MEEGLKFNKRDGQVFGTENELMITIARENLRLLEELLVKEQLVKEIYLERENLKVELADRIKEQQKLEGNYGLAFYIRDEQISGYDLRHVGDKWFQTKEDRLEFYEDMHTKHQNQTQFIERSVE